MSTTATTSTNIKGLDTALWMRVKILKLKRGCRIADILNEALRRYLNSIDKGESR